MKYFTCAVGLGLELIELEGEDERDVDGEVERLVEGEVLIEVDGEVLTDKLEEGDVLKEELADVDGLDEGESISNIVNFQ